MQQLEILLQYSESKICKSFASAYHFNGSEFKIEPIKSLHIFLPYVNKTKPMYMIENTRVLSDKK